jgi:tRNA G18 (ribose-2'-O)-methylase SpoU
MGSASLIRDSAPLSPVVSRGSAGALERMDIYSTGNIHQLLRVEEKRGHLTHFIFDSLTLYSGTMNRSR